MRKTKVLIVEDDAAIRRGLADALAFSGYDTLEAGDADRGMDMAVKVDFDLLLLDLVLPHGDGFEILKKARQTRPTLPVIILTARGEETDRVKGLNLGADDYVVKPFSVKELLARVEAVLRRSPERPMDIGEIRIPEGVVDFSRCEARFASGDRIELSEREMELLRYLAQNSGRVISREEILSHVWRINPRGVYETRTIDMHIARLREKLRDNPDNPRIILTVRGMGYMFQREGESA
ncbi:response regulator transcription factor [Candidatus Sumerlaeota bacterium]|nr:response regulator transcription factor [Candidatus Sumerlaeota bacterium]